MKKCYLLILRTFSILTYEIEYLMKTHSIHLSAQMMMQSVTKGGWQFREDQLIEMEKRHSSRCTLDTPL